MEQDINKYTYRIIWSEEVKWYPKTGQVVKL